VTIPRASASRTRATPMWRGGVYSSAVPERSDWANEAGTSAGRAVAPSGGPISSSTAAIAAEVPNVGRIALLGKWCRFQRPPVNLWPERFKS